LSWLIENSQDIHKGKGANQAETSTGQARQPPWRANLERESRKKSAHQQDLQAKGIHHPSTAVRMTVRNVYISAQLWTPGSAHWQQKFI